MLKGQRTAARGYKGKRSHSGAGRKTVLPPFQPPRVKHHSFHRFLFLQMVWRSFVLHDTPSESAPSRGSKTDRPQRSFSRCPVRGTALIISSLHFCSFAFVVSYKGPCRESTSNHVLSFSSFLAKRTRKGKRDHGHCRTEATQIFPNPKRINW